MSWVSRARRQAISGRRWSCGLWPCVLVGRIPCNQGPTALNGVLSAGLPACRDPDPNRGLNRGEACFSAQGLLSVTSPTCSSASCCSLFLGCGSHPWGPAPSLLCLCPGRWEEGNKTGLGKRVHTALPLPSRWPGHGHVAPPHCKGGWEWGLCSGCLCPNETLRVLWGEQELSNEE